jgi:hypothetical protein
MSAMRVLTVRQPWAWAIIYGGKDVENRARNIAGSYRGPVAIHAGLGYDVTAYASETWPAGVTRTAVAGKRVRGAVIGVVDLDDVHRAELPGASCCGSRWAQDDAWHLMFANIRPLSTPVPARGRLGLWRPDADLSGAICASVAAAALC